MFSTSGGHFPLAERWTGNTSVIQSHTVMDSEGIASPLTSLNSRESAFGWYELRIRPLWKRGGCLIQLRFSRPKPFPFFDEVNCLALGTKQGELVIIVRAFASRSVICPLLNDWSIAMSALLPCFSYFPSFFAHSFWVNPKGISSKFCPTFSVLTSFSPKFHPPFWLSCLSNDSFPFSYLLN